MKTIRLRFPIPQTRKETFKLTNEIGEYLRSQMNLPNEHLRLITIFTRNKELHLGYKIYQIPKKRKLEKEL
jgi:hypothetical protein